MAVLTGLALSGCSGADEHQRSEEPALPFPAVESTASASNPPNVARYKPVDNLCAVLDLSPLGAVDASTAKPDKRDLGTWVSVSCTVRFKNAKPTELTQALVIAQITKAGESQERAYQDEKRGVTAPVEVPGVGSAAYFAPTGTIMPQLVMYDYNLLLQVNFGATGTAAVPKDLKDRLATVAQHLLTKL